MLKKLSQFIEKLFKKKECENTPTPENSENTEKSIDVNLSTGEIIFPDNISEEDRTFIENSIAEINEQFKDLTAEDLDKMAEFAENFMKEHKDRFVNLEDFLSQSGTFPPANDFTVVNEQENSLYKITEELQFCEENTEHWNDRDFVDALLEYENRGYDFKGIDEIYKKVFEDVELLPLESEKLRSWYKLVSQEIVYEV